MVDLHCELRSNEVLSSLSQADQGLLWPALNTVDLPLRRQLEAMNKCIEYVYFPDSGIASVVASGPGLGALEIGLIGREGMTGLAVILGTDRSPHDTYMQIAGAGRRISVAALREAMRLSRSLHTLMMKCGYAFTIQTAQTALANGRSNIEERVARWLLMAHDRVDGDIVYITHEFLAIVLGVRRPGVTMSLNALEHDGLIQSRRGVVLIVDRAGLEAYSNGSYGTPESERRRLMS
jgi:CRP-like cAMP-binding protein